MKLALILTISAVISQCICAQNTPCDSIFMECRRYFKEGNIPAAEINMKLLDNFKADPGCRGASIDPDSIEILKNLITAERLSTERQLNDCIASLNEKKAMLEESEKILVSLKNVVKVVYNFETINDSTKSREEKLHAVSRGYRALRGNPEFQPRQIDSLTTVLYQLADSFYYANEYIADIIPRTYFSIGSSTFLTQNGTPKFYYEAVAGSNAMEDRTSFNASQKPSAIFPIGNTRYTLQYNAYQNDTVVIINTLTGGPMGKFSHGERVIINSCLLLDENEKFINNCEILTAAQDNTARLWHLGGNAKNRVITFNHEEPVFIAIASRDGEYIVTASKHTVKLWNKKGALYATYRHVKDISSVLLSDSKDKAEYILVFFNDDTYQFWLTPEKILSKFSD